MKNNDRYAIFMGVSGEGDVFYQYDTDGNVAPGFPLNLNSGIEGFVSIADIDGDGEMKSSPTLISWKAIWATSVLGRWTAPK